MTVLEASRVTKVYSAVKNVDSTIVLKGVDLKILEGEFVGVMGPSGSGKTTLLSILSGISRSTSGSVKISDTSIDSIKKDELALFRRKKLGFVFQQFNLIDSLTIKENIMLPMILDKRPIKEMEEKALEIIKMLNIKDIAEKYPYNISGGQQQRVAIGRALINDPTILFADEPTGNLDSKAAKSAMKFFEKINQEKKSTILMVTHDPYTASYCNRIVFIKDGLVNMEIVRDGERKAFFNKILDSLAVIGGE